MTPPRTLEPPESRGLSPEELRVYDHAWTWFTHTYFGQGPYVVRPLIKLEQCLNLIRRAHHHHYPSRRGLASEHQVALAWCATVLRAEEPYRVDGEWVGEKPTPVPVGAWVELGAGRRVAVELAVLSETIPARKRTLLFGADEALGLVRMVLAAVAELRAPQVRGRTDTVVVDRSAATVMLELDEDDEG